MLSGSDFMSKAIEVIPNRLYWVSANHVPKDEPKTFFFNIDNDLVYEPLEFDFGPLDIGKTVRFVLELENLLSSFQFLGCKICHFTSLNEAKRANAAFLMGAFQIIILHKTAEEAWEPFQNIRPAFIPFRDASDGACSFNCTILDCLKGIERAIKVGWFDIRNFDLQTYEYYEKMKNGDLNWIIPGKILAFSGPSDIPKDEDGYKRLTPEDYVQIFKKLGVKTVVRLNAKEYDEQRFTKHGLDHRDLNFESCPDSSLMAKFFRICTENEGPIAVHCKTGLGKTGTIIACYAIKNYMFSAAEIISWVRLCRPGSILGKQQGFLVNLEKYLRKGPQVVEIIKNVKDERDFDTQNEIAQQQQPYVSKPTKSNVKILARTTN